MLSMLKHSLKGQQSDRYVRREMRRLSRGDRHTVLGNQVKDEVATRQEATEFLKVLQRLGLRSSDRCIEIGCGSLWAAEPVIEFLQPGNYFGLDVTDFFFGMGLQRLSRKLVTEKQPNFSVISSSSLRDAHNYQSTFIFSRKTLIHVPPQELETFLLQACTLMGPTTICVHEMPPTKLCSYQLNKYSWIYALDKLRDVLPKDFDLQYRENAFVIRHKQAELPWLGQLAAE